MFTSYLPSVPGKYVTTIRLMKKHGRQMVVRSLAKVKTAVPQCKTAPLQVKVLHIKYVWLKSSNALVYKTFFCVNVSCWCSGSHLAMRLSLTVRAFRRTHLRWSHISKYPVPVLGRTICVSQYTVMLCLVVTGVLLVCSFLCHRKSDAFYMLHLNEVKVAGGQRVFNKAC